MIWWGLLLWSVLGALVTARIERDETFDDDGKRVWHFDLQWEFNVSEELVRLIFAGPLIWVAVLIRAR